jgi:glutathione S-transferase
MSSEIYVYRFSLNLKGLQYKTVWVEFPDIEALYKKLDLQPTKTTGPIYTLPVIHDPSTNKTISDSLEIAKYLDATYPSTTPLFPPGSEALQGKEDRFTFESLAFIVLPVTCTILNPVSAAYYRITREARYGKKLEELSLPGPQREEHWKSVQNGFGAVAPLLEGKKFVLGDTISFADVTIVSRVLFIKRLLGAQSPEWKAIEGWNGGMWAAHVAKFAEYEKVVV